MTNDAVRSQYFDVLDNYLRGTTGPDKFCRDFISVWKTDRDTLLAQKKSWSQPFDELLIASLQRKEITVVEFSEKFATLWGYADDPNFRQTMDAVMSVCSVFSPAPEMDWEKNSEQLRHEVSRLLHEYNYAERGFGDGSIYSTSLNC